MSGIEDNDSIESIYSEIKVSLKDIIIQTNNILTDSDKAFKKAKLEFVQYEPIILKPTGLMKEWFALHNLKPLSSKEFFNYLFSTAQKEGRLNYALQTLSFSKEDAKVFGSTSMHIYDIFEKIPTYFE